MTDTKPDLSRVNIESLISYILIEGADHDDGPMIADTIRALLDDKEAAEQSRDTAWLKVSELVKERDEARASVAAAWDAAAVIIEGVERQDLPDATGVLPPDRFDEGTSAAYEALLDATDPSATEALRRVKEEERNSAFEQAAELMDRYGQQRYADEIRGYICNSQAKEAAHD